MPHPSVKNENNAQLLLDLPGQDAATLTSWAERNCRGDVSEAARQLIELGLAAASYRFGAGSVEEEQDEEGFFGSATPLSTRQQ